VKEFSLLDTSTVTWHLLRFDDFFVKINQQLKDSVSCVTCDGQTADCAALFERDEMEQIRTESVVLSSFRTNQRTKRTVLLAKQGAES